jgi:hypothetical protein
MFSKQALKRMQEYSPLLAKSALESAKLREAKIEPLTK